MRKRTKTLLLSILTLCICTALVAGGTYALFTDKATVNNHLSAGNLDVGLHRITYQECVLDNKGLMAVSAKDTKRVDLTKDNSVLFNVVDAVPTSWYEATIEVSNLGSTAFDYGMRIIWKPNNDPTDNDVVFARQIKITVTSDKISRSTTDGNGNPVTVNYVTFMLNESKNHDISLGHLLKNAGTETFTVKAEFIDHDNNNSAMLATLDFDVQVYATQKTHE